MFNHSCEARIRTNYGVFTNLGTEVKDGRFCLYTDVAYQKDEQVRNDGVFVNQVFIHYGSHDNWTLLAE